MHLRQQQSLFTPWAWHYPKALLEQEVELGIQTGMFYSVVERLFHCSEVLLGPSMCPSSQDQRGTPANVGEVWCPIYTALTSVGRGRAPAAMTHTPKSLLGSGNMQEFAHVPNHIIVCPP